MALSDNANLRSNLDAWQQRLGDSYQTKLNAQQSREFLQEQPEIEMYLRAKIADQAGVDASALSMAGATAGDSSLMYQSTHPSGDSQYWTLNLTTAAVTELEDAKRLANQKLAEANPLYDKEIQRVVQTEEEFRNLGFAEDAIPESAKTQADLAFRDSDGDGTRDLEDANDTDPSITGFEADDYGAYEYDSWSDNYSYDSWYGGSWYDSEYDPFYSQFYSSEEPFGLKDDFSTDLESLTETPTDLSAPDAAYTAAGTQFMTDAAKATSGESTESNFMQAASTGLSTPSEPRSSATASAFNSAMDSALAESSLKTMITPTSSSEAIKTAAADALVAPTLESSSITPSSRFSL